MQTALAATTLSDLLLPELDLELRKTRRVLERLPEDKLDWQPHVKSMTLGQLGSHVANILGWVAPTFEYPEFDLASGQDEEPKPATSVAEILQRLETNGASARAALAAADDEVFAQVWTMRFGEKVLIKQTRIEVVREHFISHLIHHRAQLTVYLRLLDVPVPMVFGPTADEKGGW
jgi:uncharacterized damage-inducible protein DinB